MPISGFDPDFVPLEVKVDESMIHVKFESGLELSTPVSRFPRLARATPEQRKTWRLIGKGDGIHWPDIDEDISVRGLFFGSRPTSRSVIEEVPALIRDLYKTTDSLEKLFPDRPFTPDGHLVGSIGKVVAKYIYGVKLKPFGTPRVDALTKDGQTVQIKLTGESGTSYGFRWSRADTRESPDLLLCLKLTKQGFEEIYNGPFPADLLRNKKDQKSGQISLPLRRLQELNPSSIPQEQKFDSINRWFAAPLSNVA